MVAGSGRSGAVGHLAAIRHVVDGGHNFLPLADAFDILAADADALGIAGQQAKDALGDKAANDQDGDDDRGGNVPPVRPLAGLPDRQVRGAVLLRRPPAAALGRGQFSYLLKIGRFPAASGKTLKGFPPRREDGKIGYSSKPVSRR